MAPGSKPHPSLCLPRGQGSPWLGESGGLLGTGSLWGGSTRRPTRGYLATTRPQRLPRPKPLSLPGCQCSARVPGPADALLYACWSGGRLQPWAGSREATGAVAVWFCWAFTMAMREGKLCRAP